MLGTIINSAAIVVGGVLGAFFQGVIKEKAKETVMAGLGLSVVLIGLTMALKTGNPLIVIGSLVLGGLLGEWIDIEAKLLHMAKKIETRFVKGESRLAQAFVTTSLVYCVGAMAVTGSLESGISGAHGTLFAKAMLDGISAVVFASTLGIGVALSSIPVFLYQGTITLLASWISQWLSQTPSTLIEMSATGGLLIVAIGLNILNIKQIRVGNLLPALGFAVALALLV